MNELINDIITLQEESKSNYDIQVINQLARFKDIRCLSPYEERELEMISPEKLEVSNLKPLKLINKIIP